MSDQINIDIKGLKETKAMLEDLGTKAADRAIRKALRAGAAIEQAAIEERAPVNETGGGTLPPGALKSDITTTIIRTNSGRLIAIVQPGKLTRFVARMVEYGHRLVSGGRSKVRADGKTVGPGKQIGTVKAHSFIRTGYEASAGAAAQAMADTLKEEVTKAANRKK